MSDQLLDKLVDREAYAAEGKFVDDILDGIFKKYEQVNSLKIKLSTDNSFQAVGDTVKKTKKAQDELTLSVAAYQKILDDTAKVQAKSNALTSDAAKQQALSKAQLADQNKELANNAKVQAAANGSIAEAKALVTALRQQRDALSSSDANYAAKVAELNQAIDQQNDFIKANVDGLEKQKINIGNYLGAVNILRPALESAAASLEEMRKNGQTSGAQYESLQKEVGLLTTIIDKQEAGFSSLNREIRANREALQGMREAGLSNTKAFKELEATVAEAQDRFDDFREAQRLIGKGGEAPVIALVDALQGLAGIYGATVAAQQIFGKQNEELAESFNKLQAVLVLLNSLQQISATLGKAEAIAAGLQAGARTALTAVTRVYTFVTEGATFATNAFRAALAATGIAGLIILISSFVNELVKATSGTNAAREAQQKYNDTLKEYYDILSKNNDEFLRYQELNKKSLQDQLDILTAQGAGFREIQAVKAAIAAEDAKNSAESLENLGLNRSDVEALRDSYDRLGTELQAYEQIRADAAKKAADAGDDPEKDRGVKRAKSFIDSIKASQEALLAQIEPAEKQIDLYDKATLSQKTLAAETDKYNKEQAANLKLDTTKNRLQAIIEANNAIVANERKTEDERVEAIRDGARAQEALANAELARKLATPGLSKEEIIATTQDTAAQIQKIQIDSLAQEVILNKKYYEADYQARLSILKQGAQDSITRNQLVIDNEKAGYDQRLKANQAAYDERRKIATADLFNTLHDQTLSDDERSAGQAKFDSDILAADTEFAANRRTISAQNYEQILQDGITAQERIALSIKEGLRKQLVALDQARIARKITDDKYNRERQAAEDQAAIETAQTEVAAQFLKVNATKDGTAERVKAEEDLNTKVLALADAQLKKVQDTEKAKQAAVQKTVDQIANTYNDVTGLFGKILDAQTTTQKNAIQAQINEVEKQKQAQIEAENATLDSAQDKADKIAVINAKAQSDSEQLQLRQKQLDIEKAKFDKAKAIGSIILDTAKAVAADLTQPWKIPFDIALGAAELAIAIATPIPTYAEGVESHPGGPMVVGDGGRSELMVLPDGSMYVTPNYNTVVDGPTGTRVYPDAEKMLHDLPRGVVYSRQQKDSNGLEQVIVQQTNRTIKAIQDKEELIIQPGFNSIMAIHKYGNSWVQKIKEQVQF